MKKTKLFYVNARGECFPTDKNDYTLLDWCRRYNANRKACIEKGEAIDARFIYPIQMNMVGKYYPFNKKDKTLREWCDRKNKDIERAKKGVEIDWNIW